jgi:hypothetical protein
MTIVVIPEKTIRVIGVQSLGNRLFNARSHTGKTLKPIFEDPDVPKIFWDVRRAADALSAHHRVKLTSTIGLQLVENTSRIGDKTWVRPLEMAIQYDLGLRVRDIIGWSRLKAHVEELRGEGELDERPLSAEAIQYCINEVGYLPRLHVLCLKCIKPGWLRRAGRERGPVGRGTVGRVRSEGCGDQAGAVGEGTSIPPMTMQGMTERASGCEGKSPKALGWWMALTSWFGHCLDFQVPTRHSCAFILSHCGHSIRIFNDFWITDILATPLPGSGLSS